MIAFNRYLMNEVDFGTPFAGLKSDRKLSKDELIRSIRFMISAEYEAVQLYTQLADSIDNNIAIKVLRKIADEEKVHAGEFLELLNILEPTEKKFYADGSKEVKDME
jgi:rubrerythrin